MNVALVLASPTCGRDNLGVKNVSLVQATEERLRLVEEARRHGRRTVIVEQGRPVAAIVPIEDTVAERPTLGGDEVDALLGALGAAAPMRSAVDELVRGRR